MRNISLIFVLIILVSCTKDPIVGLWKKIGVEVEGKMEWEMQCRIICFDEDGEYRSGHSESNLNHPGTWTFDSEKNILTLQDTGGPKAEYDVLQINENQMTIRRNIYTIHMKKLNPNCTE